MQYLNMLAAGVKSFSNVLNKVVLVIAVILTITGIFIHFHSVTLKEAYPIRQVIYSEKVEKFLTDPKNNTTPQDRNKMIMFRNAICGLSGEACANNLSAKQNRDSSLFGGVTKVFAFSYTNPPASGVAWANDSLQNAGFVPKTYAAGLGFYSLQAYQKVWNVFRNVTYFVMAVAIVVIGFMIMFRFQIDSQTVISLENSLPRIVITLLLITFSYAIAGFMVDLMYVLILICLSAFGSLNAANLTQADLQSLYLTSEIPLWHRLGDGRYLYFYVQAIYGLIELIPGIMMSVMFLFFFPVMYNFIFGVFEKIINFPIGFDVGPLVAYFKIDIGSVATKLIIGAVSFILIPILVYYVLPYVAGVVILLTLFFRIIFMIIAAYTQIIINVIFAPVLILPNVIPGNDAFMSWLKRIAGNLLVFPVTIVLLIVVQLIGLNDSTLTDALSPGQTDTIEFTLPMLSMETSQFTAIICGALLILIPTLVKKVVNSIAGDPVIDAGPGVLFGGIAGAGGAIVGQYSGLAAFSRTLDPNSALGRAVGKVPGLGGSITEAGKQAGVQGRESEPNATPPITSPPSP